VEPRAHNRYYDINFRSSWLGKLTRPLEQAADAQDNEEESTEDVQVRLVVYVV
jgi:hypothetical protein